MNKCAIEVENVSKKFSRSLKHSMMYGLQDIVTELLLQKTKNQLRETEFWSLQDISFTVREGTMLGLTGLNGAGKSTLLKLINGLLKPNSGTIKLYGKVGALIELGTGFNPILTGRENIYINASVLGMTKKEIDKKIDEIIDFSGIIDFIDSPIKTYSSGMLARLGFSVAVHLEPDILLIDEILSVGDVTFREKSFNKLMSFKKRGGTIVLVSHFSRNIENYCDEAILLELGRIKCRGNVADVMAEYQKGTLVDKKQRNKKEIASQNDDLDDDIELIGHKIYNEKGEETEELEYGNNFSIELSYKLLKEVKDPSFGLSLIKNEATVANIEMKQIGVEIIKLKETGFLRCDILSPNLAPGVYDIKIAVLTNNTFVKGKKYYMGLQKIGSFVILPGKLKERFVNAAPQDLYSLDPSVILNYKWDTSSAEIQDITENKLYS